MRLQEQIIQMVQEECTEKEKEIISAYLIDRLKTFPTRCIYLDGEVLLKTAYCKFSGGHDYIKVSETKLEKTKEWLISEGFFVTRWLSPGGYFNGYKIYLKKEYA